MATSTRRGFLRGAAGFGTATLVPRIGWAAAGSRTIWRRRERRRRQLLAARADRGRGGDVPAAAARPRPRGGGASEAARGGGLRPAAGDLRAGHRLRRGPRGGAAAVRRRTGTSTGTAPSRADGALLFTTENAIAEGAGRLGIWDARDGYRRIGEMSSGGAGPHEVRLMPDGRRLAVANGGIETDPTSGRSELNLATMRSNLAYVDVGSGEVVETLALAPEPAAAVDPAPRHGARRHAGGGAAVAGLRPRASAAARGASAGSDAAWRSSPAEPAMQRRTRNYAGSVAVSDDGRRAAITAPRGGLMLVFDLGSGRGRGRRGGATSAAWRRSAAASPARPARGGS